MAAHRAEIGPHPLREHPKQRRFLARTAATGVFLWALTVVPMMLLQFADLLDPRVPVLAMGGSAVGAVVWELAMALRREQAELTIRIRPEAVELDHRILGGRLVTEELPLDRIRRIELDEDHALVFRMLDGRTVVEPLPGVPAEAREWILDALQAAREASGEFWRDQLRQTADRRSVEALVDLTRPR